MTLKHVFTYCISLLLAGWMMLAGSGLTVAHYCCHGCQQKGMMHIVEEQCDAPVHHQVHLHAACHCGNKCHLHHLVVQETTIDPVQNLSQVSLPVVSLFYSIFSHSLTSCALVARESERERLCTHIPIQGGIVSLRDCVWLL